MGTPKKEKYYYIASLEKGFRILELLADKKEMTVSAVGTALGYNRAASHRFLATLRDLGYVEKNSENRYQLTFKLLGVELQNVRFPGSRFPLIEKSQA